MEPYVLFLHGMPHHAHFIRSLELFERLQIVHQGGLPRSKSLRHVVNLLSLNGFGFGADSHE